MHFPSLLYTLAPGELHSSGEIIYSITSTYSVIMTTISFTQSTIAEFSTRLGVSQVREVIIQNNIVSSSSSTNTPADYPNGSQFDLNIQIHFWDSCVKRQPPHILDFYFQSIIALLET